MMSSGVREAGQQHISASSRVTTSSAGTQYTTTHHHHKIDANNERESSGSGGDEDVLHVVTNVYTIPIVKTADSTGAQEIHISTSGGDECIRSSGVGSANRRCRERHENVFGISGDEDCVIASPSTVEMKKTCRETRRITKRVIEETGGRSTSPVGDVTKSKFQIRSIVEIYENPVEQSAVEPGADPSTAFFKTSTQLNETTTKETFSEPLLSQRGTPIAPNINTH